MPGCCSNYHKKQNTLAALRKKAEQKNPDEFYYKMVSTQLKVSGLRPAVTVGTSDLQGALIGRGVRPISDFV